MKCYNIYVFSVQIQTYTYCHFLKLKYLKKKNIEQEFKKKIQLRTLTCKLFI